MTDREKELENQKRSARRRAFGRLTRSRRGGDH